MSQIWLQSPYRVLGLKELHSVNRDICYLYHQLARYCGVMGDLDYYETYSLPYWEYLSVSGLSDDEKAFIQVGCLIILLAMAWEAISDSGGYITQASRAVNSLHALKTVEGSDTDFYRLVETVRLALTLAQSNETKNDTQIIKLSEETTWVFGNYVLNYFRRVTEGCTETTQKRIG